MENYMVAFNKLKIKKLEKEFKTISFNEQEFKVYQYLPIQDKLALASDISNLVLGETRFNNPGKVDVYFKLGVLDYYTDIDLNEKQKENPTDTYDKLVYSGLYNAIISAIPANELDFTYNLVCDSVESLSKYAGSIYAIMEAMSKDYDNLDLDIKKLTDEISNKENIQYLDKVMDKMG